MSAGGLSREEQMEQENQQLQALMREARLKGSPSGDQRCDNCRYYAGEHKKIGYCDHPRLEILVGADWWCQWWEASGGGNAVIRPHSSGG